MHVHLLCGMLELVSLNHWLRARGLAPVNPSHEL